MPAWTRCAPASSSSATWTSSWPTTSRPPSPSRSSTTLRLRRFSTPPACAWFPTTTRPTRTSRAPSRQRSYAILRAPRASPTTTRWDAWASSTRCCPRRASSCPATSSSAPIRTPAPMVPWVPSPRAWAPLTPAWAWPPVAPGSRCRPPSSSRSTASLPRACRARTSSCTSSA